MCPHAVHASAALVCVLARARACELRDNHLGVRPCNRSVSEGLGIGAGPRGGLRMPEHMQGGTAAAHLYDAACGSGWYREVRTHGAHVGNDGRGASKDPLRDNHLGVRPRNRLRRF